MTEELKNFFRFPRLDKGIIVVTAFDNYTKLFLSDYEILYKTKQQWFVRSPQGREYFVFIPTMNNTKGKKISHLIIDSRFDDDFLYKYVFPMLTNPVERKVEIF